MTDSKVWMKEAAAYRFYAGMDVDLFSPERFTFGAFIFSWEQFKIQVMKL